MFSARVMIQMLSSSIDSREQFGDFADIEAGMKLTRPYLVVSIYSLLKYKGAFIF